MTPHPNYQQLRFPQNFPKAFPEAPIRGQEVRMECIAFGYPVPHYNWTRKNSFIPKSAIVTNYNRVLILPRDSIQLNFNRMFNRFFNRVQGVNSIEFQQSVQQNIQQSF